jgi:hypothetical protein
MTTGAAPRGTASASIDEAAAIAAPGDAHVVGSLLDVRRRDAMTSPDASLTGEARPSLAPNENRAAGAAVAALAPGDVYVVENVLRQLAEISGNPAFGRAARALLVPAGRHSLNDGAALAEMERALSNGRANSVEEAARHVAATLPGRWSLESATARLARKFRKMHRQNIKSVEADRESR